MSSSSITIDEGMIQMPPVHPGEVLGEDFMKPAGLTAAALARRIGSPRRKIKKLLGAAESVNPDMALRLGRRFGLEPAYWLRLQSHHDVELTRIADSRQFGAIVPVRFAAAAE